jgi:hypothetical protein
MLRELSTETIFGTSRVSANLRLETEAPFCCYSVQKQIFDQSKTWKLKLRFAAILSRNRIQQRHRLLKFHNF